MPQFYHFICWQAGLLICNPAFLCLFPGQIKKKLKKSEKICFFLQYALDNGLSSAILIAVTGQTGNTASPGTTKRKEMKMEITVYTAKFHGSEVVYQGHSLNQAIKIARRQCGSRPDSDCQCGGARIEVIEDGKIFRLHDWQATPPFQPANEIKWIRE